MKKLLLAATLLLSFAVAPPDKRPDCKQELLAALGETTGYLNQYAPDEDGLLTYRTGSTHVEGYGYLLGSEEDKRRWAEIDRLKREEEAARIRRNRELLRQCK